MNNQENPQDIAACRACWEKNPEVPFADFWAGWKAKGEAQVEAQPVQLTAVASLRDDGDGGLVPDWLLEGGTSELFAGMLLLVAPEHPDLCAEDGDAELFTHSDAGDMELERDGLAYKLEVMTADRDALDARLSSAEQERNNLRALLVDAVDEIKYYRGDKHGCKGLDLGEAETALSATKEGKGDE